MVIVGGERWFASGLMESLASSKLPLDQLLIVQRQLRVPTQRLLATFNRSLKENQLGINERSCWLHEVEGWVS